MNQFDNSWLGFDSCGQLSEEVKILKDKVNNLEATISKILKQLNKK